jgi:beta-phosphoglucomutase
MAASNRPLTYEQFAAAFGQRNDRFLRLWLGDATSDDEIARFGDEKEAEYRRLIEAEGLTPLPGAATWVHRLHAAGWRQAVASSAPRANVAVMLRAIGLDRDFELFVGAEDVTVGKPDPQVFLTAARRLGVAPQHCVVVEDAAVGIEAARRAGMRSIGIAHSGTLAADVVVHSLEDLADDVFETLLAGASKPADVR